MNCSGVDAGPTTEESRAATSQPTALPTAKPTAMVTGTDTNFLLQGASTFFYAPLCFGLSMMIVQWLMAFFLTKQAQEDEKITRHLEELNTGGFMNA
jgi:hypothetical protein